VVDGSLAGIGLAAEPVELVVEGGHLTSARGGQGMAFMELLTEHGDDGTNVAELGIGTNEKAILTGEVLEDEKILGSAHVAFGASAGIGGTVQVPVHLDCIVTKPTVELDGEAIVRDAELLVA
jgi:leucyl aminopeptidase (aminopeptidase T)